MKKPIEFRKKALNDIDDAVEWYDNKQEELGTDFIRELKSTINRIEENPEQFPQKHPPFRNAYLNRFPYVIYFIVKKLKLLIVAVLHTSRDSNKIIKGRK